MEKYFKNKAPIEMNAYVQGNNNFYDEDTLFEIIYVKDVACLTPVDEDDDTLLEYLPYADMFYVVDAPN